MKLRRGNCWLAPLLISTLLPAGVRAASLTEVKSVYLFPMANGLDQYLADRLTQGHIFKVVTDPKVADAVITDQLGKGFETQLLTARPDLKPVPPKPPATDDKDKDKAEKKEEEPFVVQSTFHSARGTIFLIDARSQQVVWSNYQKPNSHTPKEMERMAMRISKSLEDALNPPAVKK
jgi:hypothetical protein